MNRAWIGVVLLIGACKGHEYANCEIEVNGVTICLEREMAYSYCERDLGGAATVADGDGDTTTCADMGYESECAGGSGITQEGESATVTYYTYYATSEADCETSDGGSISAE